MRLAIWKNTFWKLDKVESIEGNHNESDGFGGIANWLHSQLSVLRRLLLSERHRLWLKTFLLATRPPVMKWVIPQFLWPLYKKFFCQYLAQIEVRPSVCSLFLDCGWFMSTMWLSNQYIFNACQFTICLTYSCQQCDFKNPEIDWTELNCLWMYQF